MAALDDAFLELEDEHAALHIASVAIFAGPVPTHAEIRRLYKHKLHLVPRFRQRTQSIPLNLGRPVWVDDPSFNLDDHLHRLVVPKPGRPAELAELVATLMSTPLDPSRPRWEVWTVEGLARGQWAIVSKLHHCLVDGVAGISVLTRIFDDSPHSQLAPRDRWVAASPPRAAKLVRSALAEQTRNARGGFRFVTRSAIHPRKSLSSVAGTARGLAGYARALRGMRPSGLNGPIGNSRGYHVSAADLADLSRVRLALGGSINDVVLAMVTTGLRELLTSRQVQLTPRMVRCLVPVSVRSAAQSDHVGNEVSALLPELPVEIDSPLERYEAVVARTARLKASHEAVAGAVLIHTADLMWPPVLGPSLRIAFRLPQHQITTVITNVPGPRGPLYLLGRRLIAHYPYVPIADHIRLAVAVTSYERRLFIGITSDRDSMPDAGVLRAGMARGLKELLEVAVTKPKEST